VYSGCSSQKAFSVDRAMILIELTIVPKWDYIN